MGFMSQLIVLVMIWWIVFFMMLPWRYTPNTETDNGQDKGAPQRAFIGKKALITTLITLPLWFFLVDYLQGVDFATPEKLDELNTPFCEEAPCPSR